MSITTLKSFKALRLIGMFAVGICLILVGFSGLTPKEHHAPTMSEETNILAELPIIFYHTSVETMFLNGSSKHICFFDGSRDFHYHWNWHNSSLVFEPFSKEESDKINQLINKSSLILSLSYGESGFASGGFRYLKFIESLPCKLENLTIYGITSERAFIATFNNSIIYLQENEGWTTAYSRLIDAENVYGMYGFREQIVASKSVSIKHKGRFSVITNEKVKP